MQRHQLRLIENLSLVNPRYLAMLRRLPATQRIRGSDTVGSGVKEFSVQILVSHGLSCRRRQRFEDSESYGKKEARAKSSAGGEFFLVPEVRGHQANLLVRDRGGQGVLDRL
jgi:hypothetical protein